MVQAEANAQVAHDVRTANPVSSKLSIGQCEFTSQSWPTRPDAEDPCGPNQLPEPSGAAAQPASFGLTVTAIPLSKSGMGGLVAIESVWARLVRGAI